MGKERCIFDNFQIVQIAFPDGDPNPCKGGLTKHHIKYRREGGADKPSNFMTVCHGHQDWLHNPVQEALWRAKEKGWDNGGTEPIVEPKGRNRFSI